MPSTPKDVAATVYEALGIATPATAIHDGLGKPYTLCPGRPIAAVLS